VGANKAYLTFDIDCLDPSAAPGTGTPIPGGLTYHQAASIIRGLTAVNFIGMDMVEVSPPYDHAEITSLAASSLVMEYLCLKAWQRGARAATLSE
jgi:agmatinase